MEWFEKASGYAGLILILVGGITYGVLYTSGWPAFIPLFIGLCLALASIITTLRRSKEEGFRRAARFGISTGASIIFLAAILVFLQTLSSRHPVRIDMTKNKRFSLAPQSSKILEGLRSDVDFTCFFKETTTGKLELEDLLKEYRNKSPHIDFRFIDPDKDPVTARRYKIKSYGQVVVESGDMEETLNEISEDKLTNAILKVIREKKKVIYFVTGHGEESINDSGTDGFSKIREGIEAESYEVKELLTMREEKIPEDCEILVIAGPEKDLFTQERKTIEAYLSSGGNVLFLLDPITEIPEIKLIAADFGIAVGNDIIIDRFGKMLAGNYLTPVVNQYAIHPITTDFNLASFFPQARSINRSADKPSGTNVKIIASTGTSAYAETDVETLLVVGKTQYEGEKDLGGPVNIVVVSTKDVPYREPGKETGKVQSRIVVIGDSDFASNAYLNLSGNRDLIMNTINWLAEEEDLIAIRPKDELIQPVMLTDKQGRVVFWIPVVGLPALIGIIGFVVAAYKKRSA